MPLRDHRIVLPAALLVVASGCGLPGFAKVKGDPPGVTVKKLTADVVFGAPPTPQPRAVPTATAPAPLAPTPPGSTGGFADSPRPPLLPPFEPPPPCPTAGPNDFPAEPASLDVTKPIEGGRYRWQQKGTLTITGLATLPLTGFTSRDVTSVDVAADGTFRYDIAQSSLLGRQVETIRVVPGDGIFLERLQYQGRRTLDFRPVVPVELLPLPVEQGVPFFSVGVDPSSMLAVRVDGTVTRRERVDACGTVVDAWFVDGTRQFQTVGGAQTLSQWDFAVAPHLGGLVVMEDVETSGTMNEGLAYSIDAVYTIGTLDPGPVPPSPSASPSPAGFPLPPQPRAAPSPEPPS